MDMNLPVSPSSGHYTWPRALTEEDMAAIRGNPNFDGMPYHRQRYGMEIRLAYQGPYGIAYGTYRLVRMERVRPVRMPDVNVTYDEYLAQVAEIEVEYEFTHSWQLVDVVQPVTVNFSALAHRMSALIPGITETVSSPCDCAIMRSVWGMIQHLNDTHHPNSDMDDPWTRERIADWLDTLDVDLVVDPDRKEEPVRPRGAQYTTTAMHGVSVKGHYCDEAIEAIDHIKAFYTTTAKQFGKTITATEKASAALKELLEAGKIHVTMDPVDVDKWGVQPMNLHHSKPHCNCSLCQQHPIQEES